MLLVRTHVAPSSIEGLGLFASERIATGTPVWRFAPGLDLLFDAENANLHGVAFREFLDRYAYVSHDFPDRLVISCDHAKFMNHNVSPNVINRGTTSYAACDIAQGDELTCDYRAISLGFDGFP
jgi:SET domain-containing protein